MLKTKNIKKRIITAVLSLCLLISAALHTVIPAAMQEALSVVPLTMAADYGQDTEQVVVALGIMTGDTQNRFNPNTVVSRAELTAILSRVDEYRKGLLKDASY